MKFYPLFLGVLFSLCLFSCKDNSSGEAKSDAPNSDHFQPDWVSKVGSKELKLKEKVYYVNDYGAKMDSTALNTEAIQKAIDACASNGGGTVSFKPGIYLTGSVFIKEGVHFNIPKGVEIRGSQDIKDYPEIDTRVAGVEMKWPAALINVRDQKDVIIDGEGLVNGQGKVFWDYYWNLRKEYEPKGLTMDR